MKPSDYALCVSVWSLNKSAVLLAFFYNYFEQDSFAKHAIFQFVSPVSSGIALTECSRCTGVLNKSRRPNLASKSRQWQNEHHELSVSNPFSSRLSSGRIRLYQNGALDSGCGRRLPSPPCLVRWAERRTRRPCRDTPSLSLYTRRAYTHA